LSLNFSGLVQGRSHPGTREAKLPSLQKKSPLTKSGHLAFKIVIKKAKY